MQNREKTIFLLEKADETIHRNYIDCETLPQELFNNISKTVTDLRIYSINVVTHMNRVREICSYSAISGKYNFDQLYKNYRFESNYLIKMKSDLDFLYKSSLGLFFNFAETGDPFLVTISNIIPVSDDISKAIRQSHYIIAQDLIFYQLNDGGANPNNNSNMNSSINISRKEITPPSTRSACVKSKIQLESKNKTYQKEDDIDEILKKLEKHQKKNEKDDSAKNFEEKKAKDKKEMSTNDYVAKLLEKDDEIMENKWDSDSDLDIEKERRELEKIKKYEEERRKEIERQKEMEALKEKEKLKQLKKEKEMKEKEDKMRKQLELKREKEMKELREKEKLKEEEKRKEEERKREEEKEEQERQEKLRKLQEEEVRKKEEQRKREEERRKKEEKEKLEKEQKRLEEERKKKEAEEKEKKRKQEEEKRRLEEERKKKEEEEKKKKEEEERRKKEEEEKRQEIEEEINEQDDEVIIKEKEEKQPILLRDKIKISKESDDSQYLKSPRGNKFTSSRSSLNKSLMRSLTPESRSKRPKDKYHISFYSGNLKEFQMAYTPYFKTIPESQKTIFHLDSNILSSITTYYNPKIIYCTSLKNKFVLKGLCIFYFDCSKESNIKAVISHLSSGDKDPNNCETILLCLIEYIKEYVECSEIYIDLYYKFNEQDNKFTIDTEIRDIFKKNLMFKWAKLENLANHVRYQKMYLKLKKDDDKTTNMILEDDDEVNINVNQSNFIALNSKKVQPSSLISLNSASILSLSNQKKGEGLINYDKYMNLFISSYLLNKIKDEEFTVKNQEKLINWKIEDNGNFSKIATYKSSKSLNDIQSYITSLKTKENETIFPEVNDIINKEYTNSSLINSLIMNIALLLPSNISCVLGNIWYNRTEKDIKVLIEKKTKHKFYLIPSSDGINSIIISPLSSNLKSKIFENNSNLFEIFNQEIYSNLEQTNQEKQKAPTLWIPCFEIDSHLQCDNLNCFENVEISKNKEQFYVNNIDEFIKVKFDYEKERESMFSVDPKDSDIVIKDDFLFGIINLDVLTNFNMSTILLFHVTKDHFMYREN